MKVWKESERERNEDYHYIPCDWQAPTAQGRHFCLFQGHNLPATDAISLYIQPIALPFDTIKDMEEGYYQKNDHPKFFLPLSPFWMIRMVTSLFN